MRLSYAALFAVVSIASTIAPALSEGQSSSCPGIAECTPLTVFDTGFTPRAGDARAMLRDLNVRRAAQSLPPLVEDPKLDAVAMQHAVDMIDKRYFAHQSADGKSPFQRMDAAGIAYGYAGENIAHNVDGASANAALWASPPHRANRLEPHFQHVGIVALATDGAGVLVVEDYTDGGSS